MAELEEKQRGTNYLDAPLQRNRTKLLCDDIFNSGERCDKGSAGPFVDTLTLYEMCYNRSTLPALSVVNTGYKQSSPSEHGRVKHWLLRAPKYLT